MRKRNPFDSLSIWVCNPLRAIPLNSCTPHFAVYRLSWFVSQLAATGWHHIPGPSAIIQTCTHFKITGHTIKRIGDMPVHLSGFVNPPFHFITIFLQRLVNLPIQSGELKNKPFSLC